ncbi:carboxylic acid reductase (plasmid) [Sphingobium sp. SJ10-10]|uniref:carboxylic acid reductase n=1 Tax=Sphingobium sp. SJ10-10 TaxID=3114999 RepID=UPI002E175B7D|nr:carboxylic acid reductase [Sphingobium sp. SJ10-10]
MMASEFDQQYLFDRAGARMRTLIAQDPEIGARMPDEKVTRAINAPGVSYREIIGTVLTGYADRPALGTRHHEVVTDADGRTARKYEAHFDTISYDELRHRIEALSNFWKHHPEHHAAPGSHIAFISFTGAEMATLDLACNYALTVSIPLQANLPAPDMQGILTDTAPVTMAATVDNLDLAVGYALETDSIRSLIILDLDERISEESEAVATARQRLSASGGRIALISFAEAIEYGRGFAYEPLPEPAAGPDHVSMIMYTSGSTGTPKGAIIHDAISAQFWTETISTYLPAVAVAYAPMNHFMGRNMVHGALAQGGTAYFTLKSDMSTLFDDFRIVRPTSILFIPRVCEIVYQHYQSELQRRIATGEQPETADAAVRAEMRAGYLGDRLCGGGVGSSPTAPEVRRFIAECWDMPLIEGYGCTEAGAAAMTFANRLTPHMITEFKLLDVPELGYYTTDKPFPRGELLVKTTKMFQGYYKRPEATASVFTEDGFLKTGDIMEQRGPDHLVWVDRRGNVIKLSQAEFVAVGPLETAYLGNSALIDQIFVYGSSYRSYLLAVVVPDTGVAQTQLGRPATEAELRTLILNEFKEVARKAQLKNFEIPRDVIVETEPFSLENGLLSSARKPLRPNLKRRYMDQLEAMYEDMDKQQQTELARLRESATGTLAERIAGAFKANLGLPEIDPADPRSYGDLGGDSLGAVGLSLLFEEMFQISVAVSAILHPAASVLWLADHIEGLQSGQGVQFADVHPDDGVLHASDLKLYKFLDEDVLTAASYAKPPVDQARNILLTGANGFLGRFLCLEWLEYAARTDGKLYCLGRGKDSKAAYARLEAVFDTGDAALLDRFRTLASKHMEMICGDLALPQLGLGKVQFDRLAEQIDQIVHPAALVNHRLSYQNLFEPNVAGTAELIRLALTGRLKRFDYVSTVAVPYMLPELTSAPEATDVRTVSDTIPLTDIYASGYGASKWAGEVLLREAHALFGLPVNVFRPNMIMPHARYVGQYNDTDMMTRLLYSIVQTGLAPQSFYTLTPDGQPPRTHYDGLPVDFLAAVMAEIGAQPYDGFSSFNMVNPHDDGVSLDSFADWIASKGYQVARISPHAEWTRRFEDKLRNLPDEERHHSSINILGHFAEPHSPAASPLTSTDFAARVRTLKVGPDIPHLSEAYIHKYLDDLHARGLIALPKMVAA